MLGALLMTAALVSTGQDLLDLARVRFDAMDGYRATVSSAHAEGGEQLRYFYRKPGLVRMEFIRPHAGAVLIYDPSEQKARLWPFGIGRFPPLSLDPGNPLIRSPRGERVDQSDVGALLDNVQALAEDGSVLLVGEETLEQRAVRHMEITGNGEHTVAAVHRFELWLDAVTLFPLKIVSHDRDDAVLETVRMDDVEIDPTLPSDLFAPRN